jgi:hypothetical protein
MSAFTLNNFDNALTFFYFGSLYLQGLTLAYIVHYYSRKCLKLMDKEHLVKWLKIPLVVNSIIVTVAFVIGVVTSV